MLQVMCCLVLHGSSPLLQGAEGSERVYKVVDAPPSMLGVL
jgi:hypothetical protein